MRALVRQFSGGTFAKPISQNASSFLLPSRSASIAGRSFAQWHVTTRNSSVCFGGSGILSTSFSPGLTNAPPRLTRRSASAFSRARECALGSSPGP